MKSKYLLLLGVALCCLFTAVKPASAQNTVVTYQGRVQSGGNDFTGSGQFKFALVTGINSATSATATANLSGQFVTSYTVTFGGSGYVIAPAVTLTGGGGSGATATAVISGGAVTAVNPVLAGSGYTSPPTVTIAAPPESLSFTTHWSNDGTSGAGSEPTAAVSLAVSNGLFTVRLGDATLANMTPLGAGLFTQPDLKLRLWFNDGVNGFAALHPPQPLTAAPYALVADSASNLLGTVGAAGLSGDYSGAVTFNNAANSFSGSGANLTSLNASQLASGMVPDARLSANASLLGQSIESAEITDGTIAAADVNAASFNTTFWHNGGNTGTTAGTHFLGTTDNQPLEFKVNGLRALRLEPNPNGAPNLIGGSPRNFVGASVVGATIAGGGAINYAGFAFTNSIWSDFGVIGGGLNNTIADNSPYNTIAGGFGNDIGTNSFFSAIGGGEDNTIAANSFRNTIAGGSGNDIGKSSDRSAIGGGAQNTIADNSKNATIAGGVANDIGNNSGSSAIGGGTQNIIADNAQAATIPGGYENAVGTGASYAFAAGRRAKANHTGAFVWADSTDADFASTAADQFLIRAAGGVGIGRSPTANDLEVEGTASKTVAGSWLANSDARIKTDVRTVTGALDKLAQVRPVEFRYTGEYRTQHPSIEDRSYLNVIAQEFQQVFPEAVKRSGDKLPNGDDILQVDTYPLTIYSAAAIQELNRKFTDELKRRDAENAELKQRLEKLERLLSGITR